MRLPDGEAAAPPTREAGHRAPAAGTGAAEARRVLLVDDEDAVRLLVARVLTRAGYHVLSARGSRDALAHWRECSAAGLPIHVVVSDMVMPETGGRGLVQQLRAERPGLPVLFMSGYVDGGLSSAELGGATAFLGKPFTGAALVEQVDALLADDV